MESSFYLLVRRDQRDSYCVLSPNVNTRSRANCVDSPAAASRKRSLKRNDSASIGIGMPNDRVWMFMARMGSNISREQCDLSADVKPASVFLYDCCSQIFGD
jgi:hypothetical protein